MNLDNPEIKFKVVDPDYSGLQLKELEYGYFEDAYGVKKTYKLDFMTKEGDARSGKPVVFFVHGGGFTEPCDKRQTYISLFAQELVKQGYAVVSPDYPVYHNREDFAKEGAEVKGCQLAGNALHHVVVYLQNHATELGIDSSRMALMGGSAGSMAGFYALAMYPHEFKGFINLWGVPNVLPEVDNFPPTLSIHGNCDGLVSYDLEVPLQELFEKKGIPHKLITLDGCDHTPVRERERYISDIITFLKDCL